MTKQRNEKETHRTATSFDSSKLAHYRCLVLNADYQPASFLPISTYDWSDALTNVFLDKVDVVAHYPDVRVHSSSSEFMLPSIIATRKFARSGRNVIFSKNNVWLRDDYQCQYCGQEFYGSQLTFDHVVASSKGGGTCFENISASCDDCNRRKGSTPWQDWVSPLGLRGPRQKPYQPTYYDLVEKAKMKPLIIPEGSQWADYLGWKGAVYERGPNGPAVQISGPRGPDIGNELIGF